MNRISLSDKPAAFFVFIFLCLADKTLISGKITSHIFSLHSSLPPVWPLSILRIHKGGILSLLVLAEWTQRTQPAAEVNESVSQAVGALNICNTYWEGKTSWKHCLSTLHLMRALKWFPSNTFGLLSKQCRAVTCDKTKLITIDAGVFSCECKFFFFQSSDNMRLPNTTPRTQFSLSIRLVLSFLSESTGPREQEL